MNLTDETEIPQHQIDTIAVLGAGAMGHGIAQVAAAAGFRVIMRDVDQQMVARGIAAIERNLQKGIERGKVTEDARSKIISRISGVADIQETEPADLFIEAVPEKMEIKQGLLREVESIADSASIFATNTSSLSITRIAEVSKRPANVIGMHFFNPAHLMRLIEIVPGAETSTETIQLIRFVAEKMGKDPIIVRDVPGFASSRLGVALGLEAMRMVEQDVASPADIDKAMELGYNHPMGPLRLTDVVGLDVRLNIAEYLFRELKSETFRPPEILARMVAEGKLGKKSGEGFYKWHD